MKLIITNSPNPPRRKPPGATTCARFSVAAARNAVALRESAIASSELGHFGVAIALEILALEEAAKAEVLSILLEGAITGVATEYTSTLLDAVLQKRHPIRHWFASIQVYKAEVERVGRAAGTSSAPDSQDNRSVTDSVGWLASAEELKQKGLYVDPWRQWSPSRLGRRDYDQAARIVSPYVESTLYGALRLADWTRVAKPQRQPKRSRHQPAKRPIP